MTITVLIVESKSDLHQSSYLTALDVYLIACFLFSMSSIVEFAWVHCENKFIYEQDIFTIYRLISMNKRLLKKCQLKYKAMADQQTAGSSKSRSSCSKATVERMTRPSPIKYTSQIDNNLSFDHLMLHISALEKNISNLDMRGGSRSRETSLDDSNVCVSGGGDGGTQSSFSFGSSTVPSSFDDSYHAHELSDSVFDKLISRMGVKRPSMDANFKNYERVSKVDRYARVLYPLCFGFFNLVYWNYYLSKRVNYF